MSIALLLAWGVKRWNIDQVVTDITPLKAEGGNATCPHPIERLYDLFGG